jgi:DNA-directed RNA polymerase specialized sigma24 family protein
MERRDNGMRYSGKGHKKRYIIIRGGYVADDFLSQIESRLLFDAVWHRTYIPSMLDVRELVTCIEHMTAREQQVLSLRFCAPDGMAYKDIAGRLGITRERVRQIETKALTILREHVGAATNEQPRGMRGLA